MSILKTGKVQIGASGTSTQNFHWRNLLDGLLRLCRGNAEEVSPTEVMVVNADNSVSFPFGIASGVLGAGQTWQNLTSSRALSTTYTNTTGRPIAISVSTTNGNSQNLSITVAGVVVFSNSSGASASVGGVGFTVVPAGSTYSATSSTALTNWAELR